MKSLFLEQIGSDALFQAMLNNKEEHTALQPVARKVHLGPKQQTLRPDYGRKISATSQQHCGYQSAPKFVQLKRPPDLDVHYNVLPLPHKIKCKHELCLKMSRFPLPRAEPSLADDLLTNLSESQPAQLQRGDLYWLMSNLCAPNAKIAAMQLMFPDSVFLKEGVFTELIKTDLDSGLLVSVKQESKLHPEVLIRTLTKAVKDRRRFVNKSKVFEQNFSYADMAVVRYTNSDKIASQEEFYRLMDFKPNAPVWQTITCIQSGVKA